MLERHGDWRVCGEAVDGVEAIQKNRQLTPHLIIMDLSMPRMSGLEAASAILNESPKLPILMLTLYATSVFVEQAHDAGIRGALSKTAMHHLADCIEALLRGEEFTFPAR